MSVWDMASAAINRAFADPEPLVYTQNGTALPAPIPAIRSDLMAPSFDGDTGTLTRIVYEVQKSLLPAPATKRDSFVHRGRLWRIENVKSLDAVNAWELTVGDDGTAPS